MQGKIQVLVALTSDFIHPLVQAASDNIELTFATSLTEAEYLLSSRFDVIVCGAHFDGCRMFDLLRLAKSNPETRAIPFLCVRAIGGMLDPTLYEGVRIATKVSGAAGFVDLHRLCLEAGQVESFNKLRGFVERLAAGEALEI